MSAVLQLMKGRVGGGVVWCGRMQMWSTGIGGDRVIRVRRKNLDGEPARDGGRWVLLPSVREDGHVPARAGWAWPLADWTQTRAGVGDCKWAQPVGHREFLVA